MANRFLSNIRINDAYTFPASDGSNGQVIVTDGAGNLAFANPSTSSSASIIYRDNFTGDGSTVAFTLQNSLSDEDQTFIYIDGVYQEKGTYSLSTNTITFTTAPDTGHSIEVISVSGINVGPTTIYQDNFTGDGTTTDFTLAQVVDNEVKTMIYFNGVYQFKGTYSLNGTALSFDTAPANGVDIEVISIASAAAADYNQKVLFYGKASEAISKGDAVMLGGQEGDHFLLSKATQTAIAANHEYFLGLASQDLAQGEFGYVTEFGKIIELDTSTYTAGDILWFDAGGTTAGALTTTEPAAPLVKIQVAAVIRSHQTEGVIFIRPTWYHELGELHDVNITSIADKDLLVWDNANGYWENSKTLGDITATSLAVDTDTLYVDAANNRVGIGTNSPDYGLHVSTGTTALRLDNNGAEELSILPGFSTFGVYFQSYNRSTGTYEKETHRATEYVWNGGGGQERARIDTNGNLGIGTTSPSAKLEVNGTFKSAGIQDSADSLAIFINGNEEVGIGTTSPIAKLNVNGNTRVENGYVQIRNSSNPSLYINNTVIQWQNYIPSGTNNLSFKDGINDVLVLGYNGANSYFNNTNVGIGTSSPGYKLDVAGGSAFRDTLRVVSSTADVAHLSWTGASTGLLNLYEAGSLTTQILASGNSYFNGGNIGIGDAGPTYKLDVNSGSNTVISRFYNSTGTGAQVLIGTSNNTSYSDIALITSTGSSEFFRNGVSTNWGGANSLNIYNSNGAIAFHPSNSSNALFIDTNSNVGIGTTSPVGKLNVELPGDSDGNVAAWGSNQVVFTRGGTSTSQGLGFSVHDVDNTTTISSLTPAITWSKMQFRALDYTFFSNGNQLGLTQDTTGKVGIGTYSPSAKLHIQHNNSTIALTYGTSVANNPLHTAFYSTWSGIGMDQTTAGIRIAGDYLSANNPLLDIGYYTNGNVSHANWNSRMRINQNGNVGIGTTSPGYKLDVNGSVRAGNANESALLVAASGTASTQNAIAIQQVTAEGDTIIFADYEPYAEYGIIAKNNLDSIDFTGGAASNNFDSYSITNRSGNARTAYVKARIGLGSGNVTFGGEVTSYNDIARTNIGSGGAYYIALSGNLSGYTPNAFNAIKTNQGDMHFDVGGVYTGYINANGGFTDVSDASLKTNIEYITDALTIVSNLKGRKYNWIDENRGTGKQVGFIAQEVEEFVPEVVTEGAEGTKGVAYGKLTAVLVEAIKEQQAIIEDLKSRIETLENN